MVVQKPDQAMGSQTECTSRCRPRFKGIETFLRRIAFNLGNSPSQTEVKIISCIPIDVTDLQHRIVTLERELEQYQQQPTESSPALNENESPEAPSAVVETALGGPRLHLGEPPAPLTEPLTPDTTTSSQDKSTPSSRYHTSEHQLFTTRPVTAPMTRQVPIIDDCLSRTRNGETPLKKKVSKKKKTSRPRTELIYFAQQAVKTPFEQTQSTSKDTAIANMLSQGYLADIARKQCRSERIPSNESKFSSPICRDDGSSIQRPAAACVSEVCSCCRGHFYDVDISRQVYPKFKMPSPPNDHLSMYYDSSMYDLVPVKEMKDDINLKKKENLKSEKEQFKCNHGKVYRSRVQPYTVTYSNGAIRNGRRLAGKRRAHVKSPNRLVPKRKYEQFAVDTGFSQKRSEQLYKDMELQTYYMRPMRKVRQPFPPKVTPVQQENAECLTTNVNNTECQTASTKSVQFDIVPPPPAQANNEATLNQIKTILQTVLTEVKTTVRDKTQETRKVQEFQKIKENVKTEPKKDAVVQKGASQNNMAACSTLLNSFYYSPYSMNPYSASFSPQCCPNSFYPPTMKCFQNYPLFIQTTGRPCDTCSKKPPGSCKATHGKHAAHIATNTESVIKAQHSKETEKLIKEIYKSIAVNFDMTSKEATTSEGDDLKSELSKHSFKQKFENESKRRESMSVKTPQAREMSKMPATPLYMNPTFTAARTSEEVSVHSTRVATARKEGLLRTVNLLTQPQDSASEKSEKRMWKENNFAYPAYSETDSVDVDATPSEATMTSIKKKERSSLFAKVCNVFKGKTKKNVEFQHSVTESEGKDVEEYEESDSDDYQTVYSGRDDIRGQKTVTTAHARLPVIREHRYRRLSHSKVTYPRYVAPTRTHERPRRPYMEQEHRRQWNEGISFHCPPGRAARHAPEQARSSRPEHQYADSTPAYWRNYETRHAYIERDSEPNEESPQTEDRDDYEMQRRRKENEKDKPKVFKSVAKKLQWFKKANLPECRHTWKKLLVDS